MGVLAILGMVAQAATLLASTGASISRLYGVVGSVFQAMSAEGRSEPTPEELEMVRSSYNAMRDDFHTDDERVEPTA